MSEHQSEEAVFATAFHHAGGERAAYLTRAACAAGAELRQRLEVRLAAHIQSLVTRGVVSFAAQFKRRVRLPLRGISKTALLSQWGCAWMLRNMETN